MAYQVAVTAAINATANVGVCLSNPLAADVRDPVVVDLSSYALAVMAVACLLDLDAVGTDAWLVEEYRAAGLAIPEWLRGPAAKEFLEEPRGRD